MIVSLVAGLGAYLFFHRTLKVGFWPAALVCMVLSPDGRLYLHRRARLWCPAGDLLASLDAGRSR